MPSRPSSPRPEDVIKLEDLIKKCPGAPKKKSRKKSKLQHFRPVDFAVAETKDVRSPANTSTLHAHVTNNTIDEPERIERIRPLRLFPGGDVPPSSNRTTASVGATDSEVAQARQNASGSTDFKQKDAIGRKNFDTKQASKCQSSK